MSVGKLGEVENESHLTGEMAHCRLLRVPNAYQSLFLEVGCSGCRNNFSQSVDPPEACPNTGRDPHGHQRCSAELLQRIEGQAIPSSGLRKMGTTPGTSEPGKCRKSGGSSDLLAIYKQGHTHIMSSGWPRTAPEDRHFIPFVGDVSFAGWLGLCGNLHQW